MKKHSVLKKYGLPLLTLVVLAILSTTALVYGKDVAEFFLPSAQDPSVAVIELPAEENHSDNSEIVPDKHRENVLDTLSTVNSKSGDLLQPGWIHIKYHNEFFIMASETFSDGTAIPTEEMVDQWIELGENGEILQYVKVQDTGDPKTTQIIVYQDKLFKNLTFPNMDSKEPADRHMTSFDNGLFDYLKKNPEVQIEVIEEDGFVIITLLTMLGNEVEFENGVACIGYFSTYQFDAEIGVLTKSEFNYISPSGDLQLSSRMDTFLVESIQTPPNNILEYLK